MSIGPAEEFRFRFPAWTIADNTKLSNGDTLGSVVAMSSPVFGEMLALFTDEDLAVRFIEDAKLSARVPMVIHNVAGLLQILAMFDRRGVVYAGIDQPTLANPRGESGWIGTIRYLITVFTEQR